MSVYLQIFLLVDLFLAGAVAVIAVQHYRAHQSTKNLGGKGHSPTSAELSKQLREHLMQEATQEFEEALARTNQKLQQDLATTADKLNKLLDHIGTDIVGKEMESYRTDLIHLRQQAKDDTSNISQELAKHEEELKAKMAQEIAAEKELVIKQLDTKLGDAIASFLVETLQHNIDLGAQAAYLTAQLEEHKAEIIKGVSGEDKPA